MRISDWSSDVCSSDLETDIVVKEQIELAVEKAGVAIMHDYSMSVDVVLGEAEPHAVQGRQHRIGGGVHRSGRIFLKDAIFTQDTIVEVRDHESCNIGSLCCQPPGGNPYGRKSGRARVLP